LNEKQKALPGASSLEPYQVATTSSSVFLQPQIKNEIKKKKHKHKHVIGKN